MPHLDDRVTIHVAAPPGTVYALLGEMTRTLDSSDGTVVRRYTLTPEGDGTRLTGSDEVTGPASRLRRFVVERLHRRHDRGAERRRDLRAALERVRATAEAATPRRRERRGTDRWPRLPEEPRRRPPRRAGPRAGPRAVSGSTRAAAVGTP
jgi:hypothetical protein